MKGNDLSAAPTPRYWVMADVVFTRHERTKVRKLGFFRTREAVETLCLPNLQALSLLWNWSLQMGVRLELVFVGDLVPDAEDLWASLDHLAANPFNGLLVFASIDGVVGVLPYRPDLLGVIDLPSRVAHFGGRGLTLETLR